MRLPRFARNDNIQYEIATSFHSSQLQKNKRGLSPFLSCGFFDFFDDSQECLGRMNGDVRKDLAVERDIRLFQTVNETAVRHSVAFCCGFNPDDPQPPEIPLSSSSVPVRILKGSLHCFFGCAVIAAAGSPVAFGLFENL